jgi:hypothetical protein
VGLTSLAAAVFLLTATSAAPPAPDEFCEPSPEGVVDLHGDTVVFMFRDCGHPMTREALMATIACEDARGALTRQRYVSGPTSGRKGSRWSPALLGFAIACTARPRHLGRLASAARSRT